MRAGRRRWRAASKNWTGPRPMRLWFRSVRSSTSRERRRNRCRTLGERIDEAIHSFGCRGSFSGHPVLRRRLASYD
ncbi:hypothetical protein SBRY_90010 [Actinacidiphila bryophytorum]|uniref:Uncharacterized protein n=1 Tax=Actinacidiphila bryophytorum TaxID=1436133 RepID=A0A9W4MGX3_9ACTN|nr:hypothetical protein SBRY_90010 [Actinacidiphila bryophytorum]